MTFISILDIIIGAYKERGIKIMGFCYNLNTTSTNDSEIIYELFSSQVLFLIYQEEEKWRLNRESFVRWCRNTRLAERRETALGIWDEHHHSVKSPLWTAFEEAVVRTKLREMTGDEVRQAFTNNIEGLETIAA